ncbi:O-antigen polymerase, partial [Bacillus sp. B-TM1]
MYNLQHRAEFTSGNGYILTLLKFLTVAICLLIYSRKFKNNMHNITKCIVDFRPPRVDKTNIVPINTTRMKNLCHMLILFFHYG